MSRARILVVDDEPGLLRVVRRVLGGRHQVAACSSPAEALARLETFEPEIAILDVRMPGMDGFELMAALKARCPGIDVILMTGSATEPDSKLVRSLREEAFYFLVKPFDRAVIEALVDRCLALRRLDAENRRHTARLESELAAARAFQRSLLPPPVAVVSGVSLTGRYEPCTEVGGDLFDYAAVDDGGAALVVADVSGHGVSAAMLTALVKSAFHAAQVDGFAPAAIDGRVRAAIDPFSAERFVTLFAARIVPREDRLEFVNAGHPPALLWGAGRDRIERLEPTGPLLSPGFPPLACETGVVEGIAGAGLLVVTDGLVEARGGDDDFGWSRITDAVARHPAGGPALLDDLLAALRTFTLARPPDDDVTLLHAAIRSPRDRSSRRP